MDGWVVGWLGSWVGGWVVGWIWMGGVSGWLTVGGCNGWVVGWFVVRCMNKYLDISWLVGESIVT